eukprot:m.200703 g.200703  ORF g.200703 m.200703 type:complete len:969 (+) comp32772_c1_seq1:252-3158(+)
MEGFADETTSSSALLRSVEEVNSEDEKGSCSDSADDEVVDETDRVAVADYLAVLGKVATDAAEMEVSNYRRSISLDEQISGTNPEMSAQTVLRSARQLFKLKKSTEELIQTELSFCEDLGLVHALQTSLKGIFVTEEESALIFGNMDVLVNLHATLMASMISIVPELELPQEKTPLYAAVLKLTELFSKTSFAAVYAPYCANHPVQLKTLAQRITDTVLSEKLEAWKAQLPVPLPLQAYLLKPIQRILKYPLLFDEIAKAVDKTSDVYPTVQELQKMLKDVAKHTNTVKRQRELQTLLLGDVKVVRGLSLMEKLEAGGFEGDLKACGDLIDQAPDLTMVLNRAVMTTNKQQKLRSRTLYLFERVIFACKVYGDIKITVKDIFPLDKITVKATSNRCLEISESLNVFCFTGIDAKSWESKVMELCATCNSTVDVFVEQPQIKGSIVQSASGRSGKLGIFRKSHRKAYNKEKIDTLSRVPSTPISQGGESKAPESSSSSKGSPISPMVSSSSIVDETNDTPIKVIAQQLGQVAGERNDLQKRNQELLEQQQTLQRIKESHETQLAALRERQVTDEAKLKHADMNQFELQRLRAQSLDMQTEAMLRLRQTQRKEKDLNRALVELAKLKAELERVQESMLRADNTDTKITPTETATGHDTSFDVAQYDVCVGDGGDINKRASKLYDFIFDSTGSSVVAPRPLIVGTGEISGMRHSAFDATDSEAAVSANSRWMGRLLTQWGSSKTSTTPETLKITQDGRVIRETFDQPQRPVSVSVLDTNTNDNDGKNTNNINNTTKSIIVSSDNTTVSDGRSEFEEIIHDKRKKIRDFIWTQQSKVDDLKQINLETLISLSIGLTSRPQVFLDQFSCRGYLVKRGSFRRSWLKRWFVFSLVTQQLAYFRDDTETHMKGSIPLRDVCNTVVSTSLAPSMRSTSAQVIHVVTLDRTFHLLAPDKDTLRAWEMVLSFVSQVSEH